MNPYSILRGLYKSWVSKTPRNALIVARIMGVCAVIMGLPVALNTLGIQVPEVMDRYLSVLVTAATALVAIIAKLQTESEEQTPVNNQNP